MSHWIEEFDLKDTQADAAMAHGYDVSVTAGAGSGKTRTLIARYLSLLDRGHLPRGLAAITFTEKAAREMRNRIRLAIFEWRTGGCPPADRMRWEQIEAEIDSARIGTIHALCAAILRAHPAEAKIDPRFDVLDEGLAAALRAQAVNDALNWAIEQPDLQSLFEAFEVKDLGAVLAALMRTPLEMDVVLTMADLVRRWNGHLMSEVRDFVEAEEVRAAIADLRAFGTGQSLLDDASDKLAAQVIGLLEQWEALEAQLKQENIQAGVHALFDLRRNYCAATTGSKGSQAKEAVKAIREVYDSQVNPWLGGKTKSDLAPDLAVDVRAALLVPLLGQLFSQAQELYQVAKDHRQSLDFDDLEGKAVTLLRQSEIRARWQRQITALMVDEFQDTNARQGEIVEALSGAGEGLKGRLFVVGDAKQSIYRFRGADVTVFSRTNRTIEARGGRSFMLDRTFRAHAGLVEAVNDLMVVAMSPTGSAMETYRVPFVPLRADRTESGARLSAPYIEFLCGLGEAAGEARPAAAQALADRLRRLHDREGIAWDHIALLFRASTGFLSYEMALEAAGVPFVTVAGRGFYDRPEIRDVLNLLRALVDPWDDAALAGLLRSPVFGLSDAALYHLRWSDGAVKPQSLHIALNSDLSSLSEMDRALAVRARETLIRLQGLVDRLPVAELLKEVMDETLYSALLAGHEHGPRLRRNLEKMLADAHASGLVRLSEFLEYLQTLRDAGAREGEAPSDTGGAVRLMTVHKAKGLEFPVVVIADAAYTPRHTTEAFLLSPALGLVPKPTRAERPPLIFQFARQAEAAQEKAEEARLLYVAATRAREKLIISGHYTERTSGSWLNQLATAAGLDLSQLAQNPDQLYTVTLPCGQIVQGLGRTLQDSVLVTPYISEPALLETDDMPLYRHLSESLTTIAEEETPRRLRRVTGQLLYTEGEIVGKLVHEAIRRWRFPGDLGFDRLLSAAARTLGLVDPEQVTPHLERATELLGRLRADPRWGELNAAESSGWARHEVPYSLPTSRGIIDLLYRDIAGVWCVVDFKTDIIIDELEMHQLCEGPYGEQMQRYHEAVSRLLNIEAPVIASLVFLDYAGKVRWESIPERRI